MNARPPFLLRSVFPGSIWRMPKGLNQLYLTFDDGPHSDITAFVVDQLSIYNAKATFFCIGKNVAKSPDWIIRLRNQGHSVGNHTFNHENGWKTPVSKYLSSVEECDNLISSALFRPPYGRISPFQYVQIRRKYKTVFWDVLAQDYDTNLSAETCINRVLNSVRDGSIITFHDSEKAWPRLKIALPEVLKQLTLQGYIFKAIPESFDMN